MSTTELSSDSSATGSILNELDSIRQRYTNAGQGHVFDSYNDIESDEHRIQFLQQLQYEIEVEKLESLFGSTMKQHETSKDDDDVSMIQPFTGTIGRSTDPTTTTEWYTIGLHAIEQGHVAALVLAGGQGTRLGYNGPKGMYCLHNLPSKNKSLFQLIAERIIRLNALATESSTSTRDSIKTPFYVMTSPLNHTETVSFFENNNYFHLGMENVYFFQQGMLPCFTNTGKIILESAHRVAMAPDGNGGIYPSLVNSGALQNMKERNIQYLHVFSIDNALVKPADPTFIGYCIQNKADCGNKVVWKSHAHEAVGVMAMNNKKQPCIVEYSEITKEMAELVNPDTNQLVYGAGNICNHFYTLSFIEETILPNMGDLYHIANKKIPYYDSESKVTISPTANNGIKLETFIFDVFPLSNHMCIYDVQRSEEFAPVKNATGASSDTPEIACEMISSLAKQWVRRAGGIIIDEDDYDSNNNNAATTVTTTKICEISPLTSYAGEGLEDLVHGKEIVCPFHL